MGSRVRLANASYVWALIGNLDVQNAQMNEHFVTLSIEQNGKWFHLARYHDIDYHDHGPDALAKFLGLPVDDIFPIHDDVREHAKGDPKALAASVLKDPRMRLSRAEIIAKAVP